MKWSEQSADNKPRPLEMALRGRSPLDVIGIASSLRKAPIVFFDPRCRARILEHLRSDDTELGGLLLGWPHADQGRGHLHPLVTIDWSVPSRVFRATRVSLAMETDIWNHARAHMAAGAGMVVGWYHSHPNLGAFFSGTDRRTQRAFFTQSYSIGLVVDPVRDEEAWFWGPDSIPLSMNHRIVPKTLDHDARAIEEQGKESTWAGDFDVQSR